MSQRYENGYIALAITCLVLIVIIGLVSWTLPYSKGYQAADKDHQAAYAQDQVSEEEYEKCASQSTVEKALECYQQAKNSTREQQRSEQDLDAQREMANWAEGMLWATIIVGSVTVGITGLGVYWVKRTFDQMDDTNKAAVDAAKAATAANDIMRHEQRPWVTIRRDVACEFTDHGFRCNLYWNHQFENLGKTPAFDIRLVSRVLRRRAVSYLRSDLNNFVSEEISLQEERRLTDEAILFPGETTQYWKYASGGGFTIDQSDHKDGDVYVMTVLTYRMHDDISKPLGVEGRVFAIREKAHMGPFQHEMLEFGTMRTVR